MQLRSRVALAGAGLTLVTASYALHFMRPLHLEPDSVCYLLTAEVAAQGGGWSCAGCPRDTCPINYPPGYPAMLSVLIRTNLATPWSFFGLNLGCLGLGVAATFGLLRRAFAFSAGTSIALCSLALLSYPVFRWVNAPLSDHAFFAVATACLYALVRSSEATGPGRAVALGIGSVLAAAAILIRIIGVALLPALVWAAVGGPPALVRIREQLRAKSRPVIYAVGATAGVALAGVALVVLRSDYVQINLRGQFSSGLGATLLRTWGYRLREWGEIGLNVPATRVPTTLRPLFPWVGIFALVCFAAAVWARRRRFGPVEAFVLCYSALLFLWPFGDARFWLPVIPLITGWLAWAAGELTHQYAVRPVFLAYAGTFALLGFVGQTLNARRSLAGDRFPLTYRDDYLGPAYRVAWGQGSKSDSVAADPTVVSMILRYDPAARNARARRK